MIVDRPRDLYDSGFFDTYVNGALESARVVAPLVCELVRPERVLDVGCGRGAWLRALSEVGVRFVTGVDGDYVGGDARLLIPPESFVSADLSRLTEIPGKYDLALCLEVIEHLSPQAGRNIVAVLTEAAPVVLFSAALPGQGGTGHVNEQWPEYWQRLFDARGYRMLDPIRPQIRSDGRVAWWYRQNLLVFASEKAISSNPRLRAEVLRGPQPELEWVHISLVRRDRRHNAIMSAVSRAIPARLRSRMRRPIKMVLASGHTR